MILVYKCNSIDCFRKTIETQRVLLLLYYCIIMHASRNPSAERRHVHALSSCRPSRLSQYYTLFANGNKADILVGWNGTCYAANTNTAFNRQTQLKAALLEARNTTKKTYKYSTIITSRFFEVLGRRQRGNKHKAANSQHAFNALHGDGATASGACAGTDILYYTLFGAGVSSVERQYEKKYDLLVRVCHTYRQYGSILSARAARTNIN